MDNPIFWIIIIILIVLIAREIMCWYWKINEITEEQRKQTKILEEILYLINPDDTEEESDNETEEETEDEPEDEESTPE